MGGDKEIQGKDGWKDGWTCREGRWGWMDGRRGREKEDGDGCVEIGRRRWMNKWRGRDKEI